jgi:D-sedoheptulose 7-phosphate isomerase
VSDEATDFLYPMVDRAGETDVDALLEDLVSSAEGKAELSARLTGTTLAALDGQLGELSDAMAARFLRGGRLLTCGNGGSATDAEGVAELFAVPPGRDHRPLAARSLVADVSVLTALANDIGFASVFSRQVIAHAGRDDMLMGFSTSGNSPNVIEAFERAAEAGVLTIGLAGYEGGAMAACDALEHCLVVAADSVHRIQEAQSATAHELWRRVQQRLGEGGVA